VAYGLGERRAGASRLTESSSVASSSVATLLPSAHEPADDGEELEEDARGERQIVLAACSSCGGVRDTTRSTRSERESCSLSATR
jgi:hypothetical protein